MPKPPIAARKPHAVAHHGITVEDDYAWLADPDYPEVKDPEILAYLEAENAYFEAHMAPHQSVIDQIFAELKAREPDEDEGVPYEKNGYRYQWRYKRGAQYCTWYRARAETPDDWKVLLDETVLAEGRDYFALGAMSVSPDGTKLAYSTDTDGSERYTLEVIDIETGSAVTPSIPSTLGSPVWNAASDEFLYVVVNEQWRPCKVQHRRLGAPAADRTLFEEQDESFFVGATSSQSEAYVFITTGDHITNETRVLASDDFDTAPTVICPRERGHEYHVEHHGADFVIRSNQRHANFDVFSTPVVTPAREHWQLHIEGSAARYITDHLPLRDHLIVAGREDGLDQIWVHAVDGSVHPVDFPEASYAVDFDANPVYDTKTLRLEYTSMVTPETIFDYDLVARTLTTLKVQPIPSGYDANGFRTERFTAPARDGAAVPVSIVYHKDTPRDGTAPVYIYAYGAYGHAVPPSFSASRISLLERGFICAIAHIRGGDDLGYDWYTQGKLDQRCNTFNDFVDCARFLVDEKIARQGHIAIAGGSAGGELMGAVANQAPELWGAIVAHVPFVDVLNTMLDDALPLTPIEWPEWGNPIEDRAAFEYIRSYSPYDQVEAKDYPPMLVTAGLNDPRVTYWEPAKWVAKLRRFKTDDNPLLLKTNMEAGHGGKSGRYDSLYEVAEEYAFMVATLLPDR
jgi:oligopeptidase B